MILGHSIILFSLAVSGSLGHWDYIAHHCARLCFAMIPLLVGLASRELGVISWIVRFFAFPFDRPSGQTPRRGLNSLSLSLFWQKNNKTRLGSSTLVRFYNILLL